jgi:8-oxo-dGTP diphosphatase
VKQRNKIVPATYLFLEKDGKVLLARRCNTGYQDGMYMVPAGHIEENELPSEALIREIKEEIGIDIDPADLKPAHICYRRKHDETGDRIDIFFKADKWNGEITNMEPNKCDDLRWASYDELPENIVHYIKKVIEDTQQGIFFGEHEI